MTTATSVPKSQVAIFAAGCFWGVEHIFLKQWPIKENKGILKSAVGYTGGRADSNNPTYRDVCSGNTNHAEALRIEFDPSKVTYDELVEYFYCTHDPTTLNSQGLDHGTQYRSAIFFNTTEQESIARRVTQEVQEKHFSPKGQQIVTVIEEAGLWYDAEDYHQEYLFKNPSGYQCATHRLHW
ncbi:peptide methionine sulfoxide reductase [Lactifluus volemus]|nr:peptide methionine sulfoxide reductase [Lactifluus volemus]